MRDADGAWPGGSALQNAAGTIEDEEPAALRAALRSWVAGSWVVDWTHRIDSPSVRAAADQGATAVRRLVEAVIDVLLERRPAEQVRRWVSRDVFALLSPGLARRSGGRFAARSMVRSIRLNIPAAGAVESTVLVQDGPRVRAVALRFEHAAPAHFDPDDERSGWRCTALQFA